ncbi:MAG: signal peptidase I [Armatimonadetes bacterium]|nr:signal peptidase I [Armatimonadota bacterium]
MDAPQSPGITEALANLSVIWILAIVAGLTVLRLGLIRVPTPAARSTSEILESGIIAIVLVFLIIRPFVVQAYYIPSPSMEPTLLGKQGSGDRILVNKFDYRLSHPHHDDVVVFLAPKETGWENSDFIKRLIGVPGDRIQVVGGQIVINGKIYKHADVRQALVVAGECGDAARQEAQSGLQDDLQADYHVKFVPEGVRVSDNAGHTKLVSKARLAEILAGPGYPVTVRPGVVIRNGQTLDEPFIAEDPDYDMQIYQGEPLKHDYNPPMPNLEYRGNVGGTEDGISQPQYQREAAQPTQPIPPGKYLMMGDNRNDSNDSTNWGLLDAKRVVGKAQIVFWPPSRVGLIH